MSIHFLHGWSEIGLYLKFIYGPDRFDDLRPPVGLVQGSTYGLGFNGPVGEAHPTENQNIVAHWPSGVGKQPGLFICQSNGPLLGPS